jgi:hypothetical protein
MRREILCTLCKELKYYYDFVIPTLDVLLKRFKELNLSGQFSQVDLFDSCSSGYKIGNRSLGVIIEFLYRQDITDETLTLESLFEAFGFDLEDTNNDDIPDALNGQQTAIFLALLNFFKIPLGIIRLSTLLTEDLAEFDAKAYCDATEKLGGYAKSLKTVFNLFSRSQQKTQTTDNSTTPNAAGVNNENKSADFVAVSKLNISNATLSTLGNSGNGIVTIILLLLLIEDLLDHLDVLIYNCKCSALLSLKTDYLRRYALLTRLRQFGVFTQLHPGIQHKAGVPVGGTFIIVYHSKKKKFSPAFNNDFLKKKGVVEFFDKAKAEQNTATKNTSGKKIILAGFVEDDEGETIAGATVTAIETGDSVTTNANGNFLLKLNVSQVTLQVEAAGFEDYEQVFNEINDAVRIILTQGDGNAIDDLPAGIVIADFYLPYRFCSDCPPIQYIVHDVVEEPTPNQGPIANAGEDQTITLPASTVTLNGSASSDPDGTIAAFQWAKLSGPGTPAFVTPASSQTDVKDLQEGLYIFELSVTDDKGAIDRDTVQVTVNPAPPPPNKPPVANAGEDRTIELNPNTFLVLDGSGSTDEDGTIVAYKWKQIAGPVAKIVADGLAQTPVTGLQEGVYEFLLTVTDNDGATDSRKVVITVTLPPNLPPVANAGPDQDIVINATNNLAVLNGTQSSDPGGGPLQFNWTLVGGPNQPNIVSQNSATTSVTGLVPGTYTFQLTVTDNRGATNSATVIVRVSLPNLPPVANAGPDQNITLIAANNSTTLDGTQSSDPEGGPLQFKWAFIGGPNQPAIATAQNATTSVSGLIPGDYSFQLTVTDNKGVTNTDAVVVHVTKAEVPVKTCGPLSDIIEGFGSLKATVSADLFNEFGDRFKFFKEAQKYIDGLANVQNLDTDKQTDFFAAPFAGQDTEKLIIKWLENLQVIILQNPRLSALAIGYYRIFLKLAEYIVCIQKEDYDTAKVAMNGVFETAEKHATVWRPAIQSGAVPQDVLPVIKAIAKDLDSEIKRVKTNGEQTSKPNYINELKKIIDVLSSI